MEDEGPEIGSVVAAVLVEGWTVEGAGGGSKSPDPVEDPGFDGATGAAGAAGAGAAGVDAKRHSRVRYSGHASGFPVSRVFLS